MADNSLIEWTDATWNPITGCSVISPGCTNCYAMKLAGTRLKHHHSRKGLTIATKAGPVWNGQVRLNDDVMDQPIRWRRPRLIFVCAHGDLFHENVPREWIDLVFAVMALSPQHRFQVLTKRSKRMREYLNAPLTFDRVVIAMMSLVEAGAPPVKTTCQRLGLPWVQPNSADDWWPLRNVWLGVSAEDQARADERIEDLIQTPAAVRWVSAEPLLGAISMSWTSADRQRTYDYLTGDHGTMHPDGPDFDQGAKIDWIVAGGESGPAARPMHPDWARSLRDQCARAGTAFHFKQWGAWAPRDKWLPGLVLMKAIKLDGSPVPDDVAPQDVGGQRFALVGKTVAGRELDGRTHDEMPGDRARFTGWLADRFQSQTGMDREAALGWATATLTEFLNRDGIQFQSPDHAWDAPAAHDLADEELSHWEAA